MVPKHGTVPTPPSIVQVRASVDVQVRRDASPPGTTPGTAMMLAVGGRTTKIAVEAEVLPPDPVAVIL
jgi:hypothetical protein